MSGLSEVISKYGGSAIRSNNKSDKYDALVDLRTYRDSVSAEQRKKLIHAIANIVSSLGVKVTKGAPEDQLVNEILKGIPSHGSIKGPQQATVCRAMAKAINASFATNVPIIDPDAEPQNICQQVHELIDSLGKGINAEFISVLGNLKAIGSNLDVLGNVMNEIYSKMTATDKDDTNRQQILNNLYNVADAERVRQVVMLRNLTDNMQSNKDALLVKLRTDDDNERFIKTLQDSPTGSVGSRAFGEFILSLTRRLGNIAIASNILHRALDDMGITLTEFKNTKSIAQLDELLHSAKLKKASKDSSNIFKLEKSAGVLREMYANRKELRGGRGIVDEDSSDDENTDKYDREIKKITDERKLLLTNVVDRLHKEIDGIIQTFVDLLTTIKKNGINKWEPLEALVEAMSKLDGIGEIGKFLSLIGYDLSDQGYSTRRDILGYVDEIVRILKIIHDDKEFGPSCAECRKVAECFRKLKETVEFYSNQVNETFKNIPKIELDQYVINAPQNMYKISELKEHLKKYLIVLRMRKSIPDNVEDLKKYSEGYKELLDNAIKSARLRMREEIILKVNAWKTFLNYRETGAEPQSESREYSRLRAMYEMTDMSDVRKAWRNARKHYNIEYEARDKLYQAIGALDLMLSDDTIRDMPKFKDLRSMLNIISDVKTYTNQFDDEFLDKMVRHFGYDGLDHFRTTVDSTRGRPAGDLNIIIKPRDTLLDIKLFDSLYALKNIFYVYAALTGKVQSGTKGGGNISVYHIYFTVTHFLDILAKSPEGGSARSIDANDLTSHSGVNKIAQNICKFSTESDIFIVGDILGHDAADVTADTEFVNDCSIPLFKCVDRTLCDVYTYNIFISLLFNFNSCIFARDVLTIDVYKMLLQKASEYVNLVIKTGTVVWTVEHTQGLLKHLTGIDFGSDIVGGYTNAERSARIDPATVITEHDHFTNIRIEDRIPERTIDSTEHLIISRATTGRNLYNANANAINNITGIQFIRTRPETIEANQFLISSNVEVMFRLTEFDNQLSYISKLMNCMLNRTSPRQIFIQYSYYLTQKVQLMHLLPFLIKIMPVNEPTCETHTLAMINTYLDLLAPHKDIFDLLDDFHSKFFDIFLIHFEMSPMRPHATMNNAYSGPLDNCFNIAAPGAMNANGAQPLLFDNLDNTNVAGTLYNELNEVQRMSCTFAQKLVTMITSMYVGTAANNIVPPNINTGGITAFDTLRAQSDFNVRTTVGTIAAGAAGYNVPADSNNCDGALSLDLHQAIADIFYIFTRSLFTRRVFIDNDPAQTNFTPFTTPQPAAPGMGDIERALDAIQVLYNVLRPISVQHVTINGFGVGDNDGTRTINFKNVVNLVDSPDVNSTGLNQIASSIPTMHSMIGLVCHVFDRFLAGMWNTSNEAFRNPRVNNKYHIVNYSQIIGYNITNVLPPADARRGGYVGSNGCNAFLELFNVYNAMTPAEFRNVIIALTEKLCALERYDIDDIGTFEYVYNKVLANNGYPTCKTNIKINDILTSMGPILNTAFTSKFILGAPIQLPNVHLDVFMDMFNRMCIPHLILAIIKDYRRYLKGALGEFRPMRLFNAVLLAKCALKPPVATPPYDFCTGFLHKFNTNSLGQFSYLKDFGLDINSLKYSEKYKRDLIAILAEFAKLANCAPRNYPSVHRIFSKIYCMFETMEFSDQMFLPTLNCFSATSIQPLINRSCYTLLANYGFRYQEYFVNESLSYRVHPYLVPVDLYTFNNVANHVIPLLSSDNMIYYQPYLFYNLIVALVNSLEIHESSKYLKYINKNDKFKIDEIYATILSIILNNTGTMNISCDIAINLKNNFIKEVIPKEINMTLSERRKCALYVYAKFCKYNLLAASTVPRTEYSTYLDFRVVQRVDPFYKNNLTMEMLGAGGGLGAAFIAIPNLPADLAVINAQTAGAGPNALYPPSAALAAPTTTVSIRSQMGVSTTTNFHTLSKYSIFGAAMAHEAFQEITDYNITNGLGGRIKFDPIQIAHLNAESSLITSTINLIISDAVGCTTVLKEFGTACSDGSEMIMLSLPPILREGHVSGVDIRISTKDMKYTKIFLNDNLESNIFGAAYPASVNGREYVKTFMFNTLVTSPLRCNFRNAVAVRDGEFEYLKAYIESRHATTSPCVDSVHADKLNVFFLYVKNNNDAFKNLKYFINDNESELLKFVKSKEFHHALEDFQMTPAMCMDAMRRTISPYRQHKLIGGARPALPSSAVWRFVQKYLNRFEDGKELIYQEAKLVGSMMKAICGKIFVNLQMVQMMTHPIDFNKMYQVKSIVGGDIKNYENLLQTSYVMPEIIAEAIPTYWFMTCYAEFYKNLFMAKNMYGKSVVLVPDKMGIFKDFIKIIFSQNDAFNYSSKSKYKIINYLNKIFVSYPKQDRNHHIIVKDFVSEINRRYMLLKTETAHKQREGMTKTRIENVRAQTIESYTGKTIPLKLPGEEDFSEKSDFNLGTDLVDAEMNRVTRETKQTKDNKLSYEENMEIIKELRDSVDEILLQQRENEEILNVMEDDKIDKVVETIKLCENNTDKFSIVAKMLEGQLDDNTNDEMLRVMCINTFNVGYSILKSLLFIIGSGKTHTNLRYIEFLNTQKLSNVSISKVTGNISINYGELYNLIGRTLNVFEKYAHKIEKHQFMNTQDAVQIATDLRKNFKQLFHHAENEELSDLDLRVRDFNERRAPTVTLDEIDMSYVKTTFPRMSDVKFNELPSLCPPCLRHDAELYYKYLSTYHSQLAVDNAFVKLDYDSNLLSKLNYGIFTMVDTLFDQNKHVIYEPFIKAVSEDICGECINNIFSSTYCDIRRNYLADYNFNQRIPVTKPYEMLAIADNADIPVYATAAAVAAAAGTPAYNAAALYGNNLKLEGKFDYPNLSTFKSQFLPIYNSDAVLNSSNALLINYIKSAQPMSNVKTTGSKYIVSNINEMSADGIDRVKAKLPVLIKYFDNLLKKCKMSRRLLTANKVKVETFDETYLKQFKYYWRCRNLQMTDALSPVYTTALGLFYRQYLYAKSDGHDYPSANALTLVSTFPIPPYLVTFSASTLVTANIIHGDNGLPAAKDSIITASEVDFYDSIVTDDRHHDWINHLMYVGDIGGRFFVNEYLGSNTYDLTLYMASIDNVLTAQNGAPTRHIVNVMAPILDNAARRAEIDVVCPPGADFPTVAARTGLVSYMFNKINETLQNMLNNNVVPQMDRFREFDSVSIRKKYACLLAYLYIYSVRRTGAGAYNGNTPFAPGAATLPNNQSILSSTAAAQSFKNNKMLEDPTHFPVPYGIAKRKATAILPKQSLDPTKILVKVNALVSKINAINDVQFMGAFREEHPAYIFNNFATPAGVNNTLIRAKELPMTTRTDMVPAIFSTSLAGGDEREHYIKLIKNIENACQTILKHLNSVQKEFTFTPLYMEIKPGFLQKVTESNQQPLALLEYIMQGLVPESTNLTATFSMEKLNAFNVLFTDSNVDKQMSSAVDAMKVVNKRIKKLHEIDISEYSEYVKDITHLSRIIQYITVFNFNYALGVGVNSHLQKSASSTFDGYNTRNIIPSLLTLKTGNITEYVTRTDDSIPILNYFNYSDSMRLKRTTVNDVYTFPNYPILVTPDPTRSPMLNNLYTNTGAPVLNASKQNLLAVRDTYDDVISAINPIQETHRNNNALLYANAILQCNIYPINVHSLQRFIPLANILNYEYTFNKIVEKQNRFFTGRPNVEFRIDVNTLRRYGLDNVGGIPSLMNTRFKWLKKFIGTLSGEPADPAMALVDPRHRQFFNTVKELYATNYTEFILLLQAAIQRELYETVNHHTKIVESGYKANDIAISYFNTWETGNIQEARTNDKEIF